MGGGISKNCWGRCATVTVALPRRKSAGAWTSSLGLADTIASTASDCSGSFDYRWGAPIKARGWDGWEAHRRKAVAVLGSPVSLSRLIVVSRQAAII